MNKRYEIYDACIEVDKLFYSDWIEKIPSIPFKHDWKVTIIPPYAGALVRFLVEKNNKKISVYLDVNCNLGFVMENNKPLPYWEIYPYEGDIFRCYMNETEILVDAIERSLEEDNE